MAQCTDVVVIGAGAAGLAAARRLRGQGLAPLVLEARDRCGGRVLTRREPGLSVPIELGAEFVHGSAPEVVALAREAGLTLCDIHGTRFGPGRGGLRPVTDFWARVERVMAMLQPLKQDMSFGEFLDGRPGGRPLARDRALAARYVAGFHAADLDRVSAAALAKEGSPQGDPREARTGRVLEGYDRIVGHLAAALEGDIRLGAVVRRVEWEPRAVAVEFTRPDGSRRARIEARAAIVTVPLGVLNARPDQRGAIEFSPALRAKEDALGRVAMGCVVRVVLRLREPFWMTGQSARRPGDPGLDRLSFLHGADRDFPSWWTTYPVRSPVIVGWCGGRRAREIAACGRRETEGMAVRALGRQFRLTARRADAMVEGFWMHDWQQDPFSRGAYSYPAVGGKDAAGVLARPLRRTLFFAGEATDAQGATATVHGALASGDRAARQVQRALGA